MKKSISNDNSVTRTLRYRRRKKFEQPLDDSQNETSLYKQFFLLQQKRLDHHPSASQQLQSF